jgi:hypothetical protein
MSDREYELPCDYIFYREGGYENIVSQNHHLIIKHGAIDFSYDENYVMFVFDTIEDSTEKINNRKLFYLIHDIKKNKLLDTLDYFDYKKFIFNHRISKDNDLTNRHFNVY